MLTRVGSREWTVSMKNDLFAELMESVREGAAILRGEKKPSRRFEIVTPTDSIEPQDDRSS